MGDPSIYTFFSILADGSEQIPAGFEVMTMEYALPIQADLANAVTEVEGDWGIIAIQFPMSIRGGGYGGDMNDESGNGLSPHGDWANGLARVFLVSTVGVAPPAGAVGSSGPAAAPVVATNCFTGDVLVETNKGLKRISDLDRKDKLQDREIKGITKTKYSQNKLIVIEKDAFGLNKPNKEIKVAPYHRFMINGKMIEAGNLIDNNKVYACKYRGEYLYNVILEQQSIIKVNGVIAETLDPTSLIAKVFDGSLNKKKRNKLIESINNYHNKLKVKDNKRHRDYKI